jgi:BASS family bile acid:Na+ symporter
VRVLQGLAWLARHGGAVIALGVFVGLLLPPLASLLRPLLVPAILGPFLITLLRIDWRRLRDRVDRPTPALVGMLWLLLVCPAAVHLVLQPLALPEAIHGGLVLMAAAPPLMASGYLALLLGLDAPLAVMLTLVSTVLMPFTLPLVGLYLLGVDINVPLSDLMLRLAVVVGGTLAIAALLRWLLPAALTERHAEPLDGLAVLGLLVFAIAIMDGATAMLLREPAFVLGCAIMVYGLNVALQASGTLLFAWLGRRGALTVGLCSGSGNLGLLLAAIADRASYEFLVFIATAQLPIYTLPLLQRPLYRRWLSARRPAGPCKRARDDA